VEEKALLQKPYWRRAKRVNGGGFCNHLQSIVTVNRDLMEEVVMPASVNAH
jgi:hypothetical protein